DSQQKPEGGAGLRKPFLWTCSLRDRELPYRQFEHQMGDPYSDKATEHLRYDVNPRLRPRQLAAQGESDTYGRVEVRTRKRAEYQDQDCEDRAGRQRIA